MIKTSVNDVKIPKGKKPTFQTTKPGPPKRITALIWGAPGSGKTYLAGTFPKPFFIDCLGGLMTVRAKEVPYVQPKTYEELTHWTIPENLPPDCQTVVLDTGTEASRICLQSSLKLIGKHEIPTLSEWQMTVEWVRRLLRALLDIPDRHIIVTAEETTKVDEEQGRVFIGPDFPGKLFHRAGAFFDEVWHLQPGYDKSGKKTRHILTAPSGRYDQAKDRLGGLDVLEVPDFEVIWSKVTKG